MDTGADVQRHDPIELDRNGKSSIAADISKFCVAQVVLTCSVTGTAKMNGKSGPQHMEFEACVAESARTCLLSGTRLRRQGCSPMNSETDGWIGKWVQSNCAETSHKTRSSYASFFKDHVWT